MQYSLVFETAIGESLLLISGTIHPQRLPMMALRVAELNEFIPGLRVVTLNHSMTQLTFERGNCRLQGEQVFWHQMSKES